MRLAQVDSAAGRGLSGNSGRDLSSPVRICENKLTPRWLRALSTGRSLEWGSRGAVAYSPCSRRLCGRGRHVDGWHRRGRSRQARTNGNGNNSSGDGTGDESGNGTGATRPATAQFVLDHRTRTGTAQQAAGGPCFTAVDEPADPTVTTSSSSSSNGANGLLTVPGPSGSGGIPVTCRHSTCPGSPGGQLTSHPTIAPDSSQAGAASNDVSPRRQLPAVNSRAADAHVFLCPAQFRA